MDRDEYLDRYTELSLQSEAIRQRLGSGSSFSELTAVESISPTTSHSPTRRRSSSISPLQGYAYSFPSAQAWPMPQAVPETWKSSESEQVDEAHLYEINHQIKVLLTDLLNSDSVRHDKMYRAWVQARLMDAEHELRSQRRRRSSVAQETVRAISLSIGVSPVPGCRASF